MNIGLLSLLHTQIFDFHRGLASNYANALKNAIELHLDGTEKKKGFFFSTQRAKAGLEDKLYVGNIHRIENHLYWNDEELADDDQIVNVVWVDGPITRDGGACSYGTKDMRDQVLYANTIPQVVGHLFYINTPGGESSARNDYEMMIADCREKGKPTVAFVDGLCASSGVNLASRCDRVIVMNPRDEFGCIGSMAAFWATPDGAIDQDGSRYVEIVGKDCPEKNAWWRDAAKGDYEKLQSELNKSTEEFHQSVRENRPLTEDWMLTGEVFEAQKLIPALVDEIGDYNRAIECVFQLADQTLPAARFAVAEPEADASETVAEPEKKPQESTPKTNTVMTEEEKKVEEAVAAEAPQTETPAQEAEAPAQEEQVATEETPAEEKQNDTEGAPAEEEKTAEEEAPADGGEAPAEEAAPADEQPNEEAIADAQAEIDRITETLHNAEQMIAEKDKKIEEIDFSLAEMRSTVEDLKADIADRDDMIAGRDKSIEELNATIDKLTKQVDALKAEIKELSEKPAPMVDANAGVPAGNGTGEAPKQKQSKFHRGMSYKEYLNAASGQ